MKPPLKSLSALILFLTFSFAEAQAQFCTAHADWTFSPPPINGQLEQGTTVEICVDLVFYSPGNSGAWLTGLELDFPPAWEVATLNVVSIPGSCSGQGQWIYSDTTACAPYDLGPGFYFDANLDGNICNNWGDDCTTIPGNMTFCFSITLTDDCSSADAAIFPRMRVISDDYFGDWSPSLCPNPIYVQPDFEVLTLNCCGVQSGTSPGTVALCESQCLFDLLDGADEGGVWTGPSGYTDSQGCGFFDAGISPLGEYTYTVAGPDDCSVSSTITVIDTDLGVVGEVFACSGGSVDLYEVVGNEYPNTGIWYDPNFNMLAGSTINLPVNVLGVYSYQFYDAMGCLMTLGVEVVENYTSGESVSTVVCENSGLFCPFEVFQSLQAPGIEVSAGGNWIVSDNAGNYLDYFPDSEICLDYSYFEDQEAGTVQFTYLQGSTQCGTSQDTLTVYVDPDSQFENLEISICSQEGEIYLNNYLPEGIPTGGEWNILNGMMIPWGILSPGALMPNTSLILSYAYDENAICGFVIIVTLYILESDQNTVQSNYNFCGDGSTLDLASLLPDTAGEGGVFSPSQEIDLLPQNSGSYTYNTASTGCDGTLYSFNLAIDANLNVSTPLTMLNTDGNSYTVTFTVTGGVAPYSINGMPIAGATFTSSILPLETQYNFSISDAGPCSDIDVSGEYMPPCTVSAGESPDEMDLCQYAPFCLFDELINADIGGVWTGPAGWIDDSCGLIDPSSSPAGDYFYIVSNGPGCADTALVSLMPIDLGIIQTMASCGVSVIDFSPFLPIPGVSFGGFWMAPGYPQILDTIPNGLVDPEIYSSGLYTYVYRDVDSCLTILKVDLTITPGYLGDTTFDPVTICNNEEYFSPAESIGFSPSGPYPPDGDWIVYDASGTIFLDFIPEWDVVLTGEYFADLGSPVVFKYIFGAPPCDPTTITLPVFINGSATQVQNTICTSDPPTSLDIYLPVSVPPGGAWIDQTNTTIVNMIDPGQLIPGSVYVFTYITSDESGCTNTIEVWLTVISGAGAGDDYYMTLCGSGEMIDMHDLLPADVDPNGTFAVSQISAIPANSGSYTYTLTGPSCASPDNQLAVYTLTFTEPFTGGVEAECNPGGTTFNALFEITGGMPPYTVNGEPVEGNLYEASGLAVAEGEAAFVVADAGLCEALEMTVGVQDTDGDGVCDDQEIVGCMDPAAINYNPNATAAGNCTYQIGGVMAPLGEWIDESEYERPIDGANFGVGNSGGLMLDMRIYPNPSMGQYLNFHIIGLTTHNARIEVCDILGSVHYSSVLASADGEVLSKINLDGFAGGVYLIRLIDGDEILVRKVVVSR